MGPLSLSGEATGAASDEIKATTAQNARHRALRTKFPQLRNYSFLFLDCIITSLIRLFQICLLHNWVKIGNLFLAGKSSTESPCIDFDLLF